MFWVFYVNSGLCNGCDIEIIVVLILCYDVECFGVKFVGSLRYVDILVVMGFVIN